MLTQKVASAQNTLTDMFIFITKDGFGTNDIAKIFNLSRRQVTEYLPRTFMYMKAPGRGMTSKATRIVPSVFAHENGYTMQRPGNKQDFVLNLRGLNALARHLRMAGHAVQVPDFLIHD